MISDREIAELVCEKVLGWERASLPNVPNVWETPNGFSPTMPLSDGRTLLLILEAMHSRCAWGSLCWDVVYEKWEGGFEADTRSGKRRTRVAYDTNPVRAVALAALLAVGVERGVLGL